MSKKLNIVLTYIRALSHWVWILLVTFFVTPGVVFCFLCSLSKGTYLIARLWATLILWFCGVKVQNQNLKHLPPKGAFVLLFNHRSYVDILALFKSCPRRVYFGAKAELFAIPWLGWLMRMTGQIPIHRQNPRQVLSTYQGLKGRVRNQDGFALAAEGGTKTENRMYPLKTGPLLLAVHYGIPIVPVFMEGAGECMPRGAFLFNLKSLKSTIKVHYLPPHPTQGLRKNQIHQIKNSLHHAFKGFFPQKPVDGPAGRIF